METAIAVREQQQLPASLEDRKKQTDLTIETATYWAKKLMEVVEQCGLAKGIQGKKYLEVEGWQMIGEFAHVTPVIEWTRPWKDESGQTVGYEAKCTLMNRDQEVVGSGESSCGFDAFPCRGKEGSEVDKAARSAAQTWAISRALRNKFSFVAKIAGYEPVPAEEMSSAGTSAAPVQRSARPTPAAGQAASFKWEFWNNLVRHCNGDKVKAGALMERLTGKRYINNLTEDEAKIGQLKFEQGDYAEPGSDG